MGFYWRRENNLSDNIIEDRSSGEKVIVKRGVIKAVLKINRCRSRT